MAANNEMQLEGIIIGITLETKNRAASEEISELYVSIMDKEGFLRTTVLRSNPSKPNSISYKNAYEHVALQHMKNALEPGQFIKVRAIKKSGDANIPIYEINGSDGYQIVKEKEGD